MLCARVFSCPLLFCLRVGIIAEPGGIGEGEGERHRKDRSRTG